MVDVVVKGLTDLQKALDTLPAKIEANIMRSALRAGAKLIGAEAKRNVPQRTGRLASSIKIGSRNVKGKGVQAYVRAGKNRPKDYVHGYYAHMVESGTAAHVIKAPPGAKLNVGGFFYSSVMHPGFQARPYMRPAIDSQQAVAIEAVAAYIRKRLADKHGIDVPDPAVDDEAGEVDP
jgi:HK97 gp10 family phage protein